MTPCLPLKKVDSRWSQLFSGVDTPIECTDPFRDLWTVRWDFRETGSGETSFAYETFTHRPTAVEIRRTVNEWASAKTREEILTGFNWKGVAVWLSTENQNNYRGALQRVLVFPDWPEGLRVKGGTDEEPQYLDFCDIEELKQFVTAMEAHIMQTLRRWWDWRDRFDITPYTETQES